MNQREIEDLQARLRARALNVNEQPSTTRASDDDECAFVHVLPSGNVRCGALRRHHSQYTGHQFTEPRPPAPRAGERDAASIVSASALQLAQKIDQVYDTDLSNHLLAAVQAEHNQHATLIEQRERLVSTLKQAREFICVQTWPPNKPRTADTQRAREAEGLVARVDAVLATIEQEGEA